MEASLEASHSKSSSCAKAYRFIVNNSELCFWGSFSADFLQNLNPPRIHPERRGSSSSAGGTKNYNFNLLVLTNSVESTFCRC